MRQTPGIAASSPGDRNHLVTERGRSVVGFAASLIDRLLREVSSWFELTVRAAQGTSRAETVLLLAIVAAGAVLRFWGLGNVGLHGDEKTMALPVMHLITHGEPLMPSGMFYPRALGQVYLMAASVEIFGQSEWAMRLPSAVCGVMLIVVAYFLGRRFLTAPWRLAFAAVVALQPDFIEAAQTARMYVFFVTGIALFLLLLFNWERTGRTLTLIGAVAVLAVTMQFHTLTVFSAPLLLFPGLLQGDRRKTVLGAIAFAVVAGTFLATDAWVASAYPQTVAVDGAEPLRNGAKAAWAIPQFTPLLLAAAGLAAAAIAAFVMRGSGRRTAAIVAGVLIGAGLFTAILFSYHVALLLLIAGLVVAQRSGSLSTGRLLVLLLVLGGIAVAQVLVLRANGVESLRLIAGAMTGRPSIWPYIVASHYSELASFIIVAAVGISLWRLAHREPVPDFVLFIVLGVWVPLVLIGALKWWILPRYADGQAIPLLLGAMAGAQWFFARIATMGSVQQRTAVQAGVAAILCVLVVNPLAVARAVDAGYDTHPDHKGAAEFMKTIALAPDDVVVAEDSLQQTYYLGHVDYWLNSRDIAQQFVRDCNGKACDIYTNAPLIGSGADLQALLDKPDRGAVYVIGSGENYEDGRRANMRGDGILEVLESPQFTPIFEGRDHFTKIWQAPRPHRPVASAESSRANR